MIVFLFILIIIVPGLGSTVYFVLSPNRFQYQPSNIILSLSTFPDIRTLSECAMRCLHHLRCRIFDFDEDHNLCQIFEGSVDTGALTSTVSNSVVGWMDMKSSDYLLYHASFNQCININHRYLFSDVATGLCQCPAYTFWNGSMCLNQRFVSDRCLSDEWCRSDLNLRCNGFICLESSSSTWTTPITDIAMTSISTCVPTVSSNGILYSIVNPSTPMTTYICFARTWIATSTTATLSFFFRHDPGYWFLDDISVYHGISQVLTNGGFENLAVGWSYSGSCSSNTGGLIVIDPAYVLSGQHSYSSRCIGFGDTISQTFLTVPGDAYLIKFWLRRTDCCSPIVIANITVH